MRTPISLLSLTALLVSSCHAKLSFKGGKASISGADATVTHSVNLDPSKTAQLNLASDETFKMVFTVFDDEKGADVMPHQAFLRFWDEKTEEEGIVPVKVARDGKARFSMNVRKPPTGLPPTTENNPLKVSLILGSFTYEGAVLPVFDITLPPSGSVPPHPDEALYHPQPEIFHTFRPDQKLPPKPISFLFAGLTLAPWLLLFGFLSKLPISLAPTTKTIPFIACLAAFEGLLFWYWVDLYLGQVLTYGAVLGLLTAVAGKHALSSSA
ncbi:hypothetical protein FRB94_013383 [Tulasnella sp. JGI-2019a]|nr:hypothetical protein FRB93_002504 [Tulasnella sp. JGI-2019a]KAG9008337.1 hypothetical protein FRB94_013383 [Tulasnella sp. JGI-2019a]KAG9037784.1 hypothetical protein FRB95_004070 [Tulasnella sp. JGI-2019a]